MAVLRHDTRLIRSGEDVVGVRQVVREWAITAGFSLVEQTKIVTAASELARNVVQYGGCGSMRANSAALPSTTMTNGPLAYGLWHFAA